jgi:hypothetical protein
MMNSRSREAAQRAADRRRREDEAARLVAEVPRLATLRLRAEERLAGVVLSDTRHVRYVVVERAPALFDFPCGDPSCQDGGHIVTSVVMRELREQHAEFVLEDECLGTIGTARCRRILHVVANATYR